MVSVVRFWILIDRILSSISGEIRYVDFSAHLQRQNFLDHYYYGHPVISDNRICPIVPISEKGSLP
jgi:hypothetical protein